MSYTVKNKELKAPLIFAHRGGRKWAPENTLAAFERSKQANVAGVELDIQRCSSGELVVFHDADLGRTTNGAGLIRDASLDELKRLSAGQWFDKSFCLEKIPTLQEVLDILGSSMLINIELKNLPVEYPHLEDDLVEALNNFSYKDNLIISSFDHKLLRNLHLLDSSLKIGLLGASLFLDLEEYAKKIGASYLIAEGECIRKDGVDEAHQCGMQVFLWTLNNIRDWYFAIQIGADAIITDDPEGLKAYLDKVFAPRVASS